jgi:hypothetical protein
MWFGDEVMQKNVVLSYTLKTAQTIWQMALPLRDMHVQLTFDSSFLIIGGGTCIWVAAGTLMAYVIALNYTLAYDTHKHITRSTAINVILMSVYCVRSVMANHPNQHGDVQKQQNLFTFSLQLARASVPGGSQ